MNIKLLIMLIYFNKKNNAFNENYRRHFKINKLLKNKMKRKEVKILGLSYSQDQMGSYILVLSERKGKVKIPIIIKHQKQRIALN
jgi:hypothetical protein